MKHADARTPEEIAKEFEALHGRKLGSDSSPAPCSQMRATPETDAVWADKSKNILEHARRMERERDAALARESAMRHFCEVEMSWEWFRAEFNIGDTQNKSLQNAKKLKEFLSANA
jgi:hypothetical protein